MKQEVMDGLQEVGVHLHSGGFGCDSFASMMARLPLVAIWYESEEPTLEEMQVLAAIVKERADLFRPSAVENFRVEGVNTVTLKKIGGQWTFRRLTWTRGPTWSPRLGTIQQIRERLGRP